MATFAHTAKSVREIALELPAATRVFEQLGIDYCCGGQKPLAQACEERGLALESVIDRLTQINQPSDAGKDWNAASLRELIEHIVVQHHSYVKSEVPRLEALIARVKTVHGKRHPELQTVQETFQALGQELASHLMKEENILFPYLGKLEQSKGHHRQASCFGSVENPIRMMTMEHESAGDALGVLREVTQDYKSPDDACVSYRTLYGALEEFEADLHQHIHLENNILFPRAVALEKSACDARHNLR